MSRRLARKAALQALYQIEVGATEADRALEFVTEENGLNESQAGFARLLVSGVLSNIDCIDRIITEISIDWDLKRMAAVDRNILRQALYEMCFSEDVPPNVAVNEAIELGKTFGSAESGKFINGILGQVIQNIDKYRATRC